MSAGEQQWHSLSVLNPLPDGEAMRCYLMRKCHIAAVEFLAAGQDEALIEQGRRIYCERTDRPFDGFEVWDGARRVYVFPEESDDQSSS